MSNEVCPYCGISYGLHPFKHTKTEKIDMLLEAIESLLSQLSEERQLSARLLSALKEAREICRTDSTDTVNIHGVSVCSKAIQSYERGVNE